MYLDIELDTILISTYSAKQCKKAKKMSTTLREIGISVRDDGRIIFSATKVETHEEIMTQLDHFRYDVDTFVNDITK